jgi:hypothetical protein
MVSAYVVEVFDLVDPDNPVLACKRLFQRAELGALLRQSNAAHTVLGLASGEQRVVVIVRHFVPKQEGVSKINFHAMGGESVATHMSEFRIVGVASSSTLYSPLAVK